MARPSRKTTDKSATPRYVLTEQVGYMLRQALQRNTVIFNQLIGDELTPPQWAVLSQLFQTGESSQNLLGRQVSMDVATIKGVVDRLIKRKLVAARPDPIDGRRIIVGLTVRGTDFVEKLLESARAVSEETLSPLSKDEAKTLLSLLQRLR
jgi:DNA-binding MarR family transcriptional regulator